MALMLKRLFILKLVERRNKLGGTPAGPSERFARQKNHAS